MKLLLISAILLLFSTSCFGFAAEKNETDKMIYIKVKLIEGKPSEINYEILEGKIKTPKVKEVKPNDIYFELLSNKEELIYDGVVPDLSTQNYEYVDDNGKLNSVEVKRDSIEIVIRTNYKQEISKINLFKIPTEGSLKKSKEEFMPLGSFEIKLK